MTKEVVRDSEIPGFVEAAPGIIFELAQCDGCGFTTNRPDKYRSLIREAFKIACCPEMRFKRFEAEAITGLLDVV